MQSWHSYPSIYTLGHRYADGILNTEVNVEEKVDGSQFSFGKGLEGNLLVRSKGQVMNIDAPDKMFNKAIETVKSIANFLTPGWTYRCEYLQKPKHNTLAYSRVPVNHLIVFDINTGEESYLNYQEKYHEAAKLDLETVPLIYSGKVASMDQFKAFLDRDSVLGGCKIEGVVVKPKNYDMFGLDKKCVIAKFVSDNFKELHRTDWKIRNPTQTDICEKLIETLSTEARWEKAIQHLRELGKIEDSPKDIGPIIKEIPQDVQKECEDLIKQKLFEHFWPQISRGVVRGFPEWYKAKLLTTQFDADKPLMEVDQAA